MLTINAQESASDIMHTLGFRIIQCARQLSPLENCILTHIALVFDISNYSVWSKSPEAGATFHEGTEVASMTDELGTKASPHRVLHKKFSLIFITELEAVVHLSEDEIATVAEKAYNSPSV
jgi:uncharacterized small protein (DUF1192 family)